MTQDQKFLCLQAIFSLAWVDDFHNEESEFLQSLIDQMQLASDKQSQVLAWFSHAPPVLDWQAITQDDVLATMILKKALHLSMLDMSVTAKELSFLQKLREKMGLEESVFYRLQSDVEKELFSK